MAVEETIGLCFGYIVGGYLFFIIFRWIFLPKGIKKVRVPFLIRAKHYLKGKL